MPPTNTKKRSAPGSSPAMQAAQMAQTHSAPTHGISNPEYMRYNQDPENAVFQDSSVYNMNAYGGNGIPQGQYDIQSPGQSQSTQLARRPISRQLVPTGQRYDFPQDSWAQFGQESMQDPQQGNVEEDNIEILEEKAAVAKRDAQSKRKQIPPFVQKLSSFLDGAKNTELIRWSERGDSFVVLDEDEFAKTLIPELFKHNNYASFVRQLNMYGFHKRVGLSDNSMKASERKNKSPSEYYNPYFKRGHPNLLWLINKPKNGGKGEPKKEAIRKPVKFEPQEMDSDDEGQNGIEEVYRADMPGTRALSQAPESGPLQKRELAVVQHQLAEIQKQQGQITNALTRLRKDHTQLFQQSLNFQQLHDRHENSINAILTFLATVYNRSLDGSNPQNFAQMFANGIPQEQHNQGNVVELGDQPNTPQTKASASPQRRAQRLLMAPPSGRSQTNSPTSTPRTANHLSPQPRAVEELLDTSPPDTTSVKHEQDQQNQQHPDAMMNIINNTNAQAGQNINGMEFPEMLQHYENANGHSPLTSEVRNNMLNIMANSSSTSGSNNALVSPTPPEMPSLNSMQYTNNDAERFVSPTPPEMPNLDSMQYTNDDIERLLQAHNATGSQIESLKNIMEQPPPPSGNRPIPIMDDNTYFNNGLESHDGLNGNYDVDQYLDPGAFLGSGSPTTGGDYNFDQYNDGMNNMGDSHFDIGIDGTTEGERVLDTAGSTPDRGGDDTMSNGITSPRAKRRRAH